jgi:hypothetical protein
MPSKNERDPFMILNPGFKGIGSALAGVLGAELFGTRSDG